MKVVLKPGGLVLIAVAMIVMVALVVSQYKPDSAVAGKPSAGVSVAPKSDDVAPKGVGKEVLVNGNFEGGFRKYAGGVPTDKLSITGNLGEKWSDNSGWAKIAVAYDRDTQNPHSGQASQRMTISKKKFGQAQFAQEFQVPVGTKLTGTIWIRANAATNGEKVDLWLRDKDDPAKIYGRQTVAATTQWKPFTVSGTVTEKNPAFFMVLVTGGDLTVWLDDATVTPAP